ncbi:hypothetical protein J6TS1_37040 [Siminovitchia terrae]|uniref:Uncharacterized protein n=1 Tax=Siminovitchia terrae TaxID=1914933 RepID=A0ABQ4L0U6_SIMTE|nr:hypothetical protein J22TS1_09380 [Siminovitchia terrae]GIN97834.1 hypothetical protein J6TS1_37040 [Siminovitchia terrae]
MKKLEKSYWRQSLECYFFIFILLLLFFSIMIICAKFIGGGLDILKYFEISHE